MGRVIKSVFDTVESIASGAIEGSFELLDGLLFSERKTEYNSRFIRPAEGGLSRFNKGFCLTGTQSLSVHQSFSNCSLFGPSGSGKSSIVIVPTVYSLSRAGATMCINDPSGELYELVSGYLHKRGYIVLRLDFSSPERSEGFNPLARCRTVSDIQRVVHLILQNTVASAKADPFWDRSSEMLITLFARYLVFYAASEYRTFTNVLRLIEAFSVYPKKIDRLMVATHDDEILSSYRATVTYGDKTIQSIIATSRAALNLFSDPTVIRTTSTDTIDFSRFRKEKVALFICNPIQHIHYYKSISAVFFENLFSELMSRIPGPDERAVFCILDEAATMKFSSLSTTISSIRKYRAGIMLAAQDYQSWVSLYGQAEAHSIRTNTYAQIFLKGQPLDSCRELEAILGRFTFTKDGVEKVRLLLSADEIRTLQDEAIILLGNNLPVRARVSPFYENDRLRNRSRIPQYEPVTRLPSGAPPLIPFDEA